MWSLKDLKKAYRKGEIKKAKFINEMHVLHKFLFQYKDIIKDTNISKIEISDRQILMTLRDSEIKMIIDREDKRIVPIEILNFGSYEKNELEIIEKLININFKRGFSVFDIGANMGWLSMSLSKKINKLKFYAFEPIPKTFNYLNENIKIGEIKNIKTYNIGFSDKKQIIDLFYYPEGSGNASLVQLSDSDKLQKVRCKMTTLDDFSFKNKLKVDFIKCDVEGAELLVIKGGIETIKRNKPIIFVEMLRKWALKFNYHPNEIIKMLNEIGYKSYKITNSGLKEFSKMDEGTKETNFIFINPKKHKII